MNTEPKKIEMWETSDGKIHHKLESARCHQVFLDVNHELANFSNSSLAQQVITTLAAKYDFVKRSPA